MGLINCLKQLAQGYTLTLEEQQDLLKLEIENDHPFEVNLEKGLETIRQRSQLFRKVYPQVYELCQSLGFKDSESILKTLWRLWLPLSIELVETQKKLGHTLILGILGGQGTGKTTLTEITHLIIAHLGSSSFSFSIDDLYKSYAKRQELLTSDPRLIWRGPPGTHDIEDGIEVLKKARECNPQDSILVPCFDKSLWEGQGDRIEAREIKKADIVIFEGWFVGVRSVELTVFNQPLEPILAPEDQQFAKDTNERLKDYLPLWEKLDRLMILYPVDYRLSKQWRKEAEQKMKATGKTGMTDEEIDQFVEYFWKALHPEIFIKPLINNPELTDWVVEINADHSVGKIKRVSIQ